MVVSTLKKRNAYLETKFITRESEDSNDMVLEGYFVKFNSETEIFEGYFEKIAPQAIKDLNGADIRALFNHDSSMVLGRTVNDTLKLVKDDVGLKGTIKINQEDPEAVAVYARVKRGDISGCSFGFYVTSNEIEKRSDGTVLDTITGLELIEVSTVTFPAYPQTEINARSKDLEVFKSKELNYRKAELKERFKNE